MRQTHKGKATLQHQTPRSAGAQPHKKREGGGVGCRNGGGGAFTWEGVWKAGTEGKEEIGVEDPTRFKSAAAHARAYQHLSMSAHTQERQTASIRPAPSDHRQAIYICKLCKHTHSPTPSGATRRWFTPGEQSLSPKQHIFSRRERS